MANYSINDYIEKFQPISAKVNAIYEIVDFIKIDNFSDAYSLLEKTNISFYEIISITQRLKINKFVKFVDYVIQQKG